MPDLNCKEIELEEGDIFDGFVAGSYIQNKIDPSKTLYPSYHKEFDFISIKYDSALPYLLTYQGMHFTFSTEDFILGIGIYFRVLNNQDANIENARKDPYRFIPITLDVKLNGRRVYFNSISFSLPLLLSYEIYDCMDEDDMYNMDPIRSLSIWSDENYWSKRHGTRITNKLEFPLPISSKYHDEFLQGNFYFRYSYMNERVSFIREINYRSISVLFLDWLLRHKVIFSPTVAQTFLEIGGEKIMTYKRFNTEIFAEAELTICDM